MVGNMLKYVESNIKRSNSGAIWIMDHESWDI
jgi:hypothetical protein